MFAIDVNVINSGCERDSCSPLNNIGKVIVGLIQWLSDGDRIRVGFKKYIESSKRNKIAKEYEK